MAIAEADMGLTQMAFEDGQQRDPGDDQLLVKFELVPMQNQEKTEEEGRPIFEEVEFVHIMVPGQKDNIYYQPATEYDRQRFPEHYARWKTRQEGADHLEGTPLAEWPGITRSQVKELEFFNVFTVEQLANISDANAQNFMGIQILRQAARVYVEKAKDAAADKKLARALEERDNEISSLKTQISEMAAMLKEMRESGDSVPDGERHTEPKRGRGRPRTAK